MKHLLLLGLFFSTLASGSALAAGNGKNSCSECAAAQKLTKEIKKLNYSNEKDRFKGGEKVQTTVSQLEKFSQLSKKDGNRAKLFGDLLVLSREAGPYDGEGQVGQVMTDLVQGDADLKKAFDSFIQASKTGSKAELCKTAQLDKTVAAHLCLDKAGVRGQDLATAKDPVKAKSCDQSFNYEACLKDGAGL